MFGAASLCSAALIVPPLEGVLAGVICLRRLSGMSANMRRPAQAAGPKTVALVQTTQYLVLIGLDLELQSVKLTR